MTTEKKTELVKTIRRLQLELSLHLTKFQGSKLIRLQDKIDRLEDVVFYIENEKELIDIK